MLYFVAEYLIQDDFKKISSGLEVTALYIVI